MGRPLYTNNAYSALAQGITPTQTTIQIDGGTGVLFPSPTGSDYFYATITSISNPNSYEIIQVTNNTNNVFTCVRGAENTTPQYFNISDNIELRITAAGLNTFSGANTASNISYVPSGTLTSTNVQGAIDQLEVQVNTGGAVVKQEYQTAYAGQTIFNISSFTYAVGSNGLFVYVNGNKQIKSLNYTETSNSSITFSTGLNVGDIVEFVYI